MWKDRLRKRKEEESHLLAARRGQVRLVLEAAVAPLVKNLPFHIDGMGEWVVDTDPQTSEIKKFFCSDQREDWRGTFGLAIEFKNGSMPWKMSLALTDRSGRLRTMVGKNYPELEQFFNHFPSDRAKPYAMEWDLEAEHASDPSMRLQWLFTNVDLLKPDIDRHFDFYPGKEHETDWQSMGFVHRGRTNLMKAFNPDTRNLITQSLPILGIFPDAHDYMSLEEMHQLLGNVMKIPLAL